MRPTMDDVAARAGVSRALVSLVMRDSPKVSAASRELVLEAAGALGYRPNLHARNLASGRTHTIGALLMDLHNPFFAGVVDGIETEADRRGYQVIIRHGRTSADIERTALETFHQFRTDGIVLIGSRLTLEDLEASGAQTPTVVVGRRIESEKVDTVNTDDHLGARLAVEHLVALGHERIAHIGGGDGAGSDLRQRGYADAMRAFDRAAEIRVIEGDHTMQSGGVAARRLFDDGAPPTAIFTVNDLVAAGALNALASLGVSVPDDVSLVGYDNTLLSSLGQTSLTSVNQPTAVMGQLAMSSLVERIEDDRERAVHHLLAPSLIERTSSGPPA